MPKTTSRYLTANHLLTVALLPADDHPLRNGDMVLVSNGRRAPAFGHVFWNGRAILIDSRMCPLDERIKVLGVVDEQDPA